MACDGICRSIAFMCSLNSFGFTIKDNVKTSADSEFAYIIMHHHASYTHNIHLSSFPWWWKGRQGCSDEKDHVCFVTYIENGRDQEWKQDSPKLLALQGGTLSSTGLLAARPARLSRSTVARNSSQHGVFLFWTEMGTVCLKIGYPKTSSHKFSFFRNYQFLGYPKVWYKAWNLIVVSLYSHYMSISIIQYLIVSYYITRYIPLYYVIFTSTSCMMVQKNININA